MKSTQFYIAIADIKAVYDQAIHLRDGTFIKLKDEKEEKQAIKILLANIQSGGFLSSVNEE